MRNYLHRYLPSHFRDPVGLLLRLIRTKNTAALFAIGTSLLALLTSPIDIVLYILEKRLYLGAEEPKLPIILVTGPPRSGTTLTAQVLINFLPVTYFNNLTAIFQRSPIAANMLFKKISQGRKITYSSYYGKTLSFSGPNDGLYLWDRWVGKDRTRIPNSITDKHKSELVRFFGAYEDLFQKPILNKNNSLCTYASLIADILPSTYFICLTRDPSFLAQSLLKARSEIHGDPNTPYGIYNSKQNNRDNDDHNHIKDVCEQVLFYETTIREQQKIIGDERFWIISYEEFCRRPEVLVKNVADEILKHPVDTNEIRKNLKPFQNANRVKIEVDLFNEIQATLHTLDKGTLEKMTC